MLLFNIHWTHPSVVYNSSNRTRKGSLNHDYFNINQRHTQLNYVTDTLSSLTTVEEPVDNMASVLHASGAWRVETLDGEAVAPAAISHRFRIIIIAIVNVAALTDDALGCHSRLGRLKISLLTH